jgi:hypothetical protein
VESGKEEQVMSIADFGKPLCATREEAEEFITEELTRAAPPGWEVERYVEWTGPDLVPRLTWRVYRSPAGQGRGEYGVRLAASLDLIVFTYGNTDAGVITAERAMLYARVIDPWDLRRFGMAACLELVMNSEPNLWGYT